MRRALGTVLVLAGALLLADVGLTLAWQEPVSAVRARLAQDGLRRELRALTLAEPPAPRLDRRRVAAAARSLRRRAPAGRALARLRIPRIGLDAVVVAGTRPGDLRRAPGFLESAPLPGEPGTAAIAGHRTTYGAHFRRIDALRRGDGIAVRMAYATLRYLVEATRVVDPGALEVLRRADHDRLVLSACHPLFSAARRIVVLARRTGVERAATSLKRDV
jgi:sortase A